MEYLCRRQHFSLLLHNLGTCTNTSALNASVLSMFPWYLAYLVYVTFLYVSYAICRVSPLVHLMSTDLVLLNAIEILYFWRLKKTILIDYPHIRKITSFTSLTKMNNCVPQLMLHSSCNFKVKLY